MQKLSKSGTQDLMSIVEESKAEVDSDGNENEFSMLTSGSKNSKMTLTNESVMSNVLHKGVQDRRKRDEMLSRS